MLKRLSLSLTVLAAPLAAEAPRVIVDIPPIHSLTAQVMEGIGAPELLTQPGANPHGHALRPSEAQRLQEADLLIWVGPRLSPWLGAAKDEMAPNAHSLALIKADGIELLEKRGAHDHHHGDEHAHEGEHAQGGHGDKHDEDHAHDGDDHEHEDQHAHDDHGHKDEDKHEHEDHAEASDARIDPHIWLSPDNAIVALGLIAEELAEHDTANAESYRANASAAIEALRAQVADIETRMANISDKEYLTAHDAYQYFEARFGLTSHAALTDSDDKNAGPAHLRDVLSNSPGLGCLVSEPGTPAATIRLVTETLGIPAVEIDPLGTELPVGAAQYNTLLETMAKGFEKCLGE